jgi:PAS domain S-box-containing protein
MPDESLWEHAPCAFHSLDAGGVLRRVNATWLRWLGYERGEVENVLTVDAVLTPESLATLHENSPRLLAGGRVDSVEVVFVRKDGSTLFALLTANAAFDEQGRFTSTRSLFIDIGERKRAEQYLRRLVEAAPDATVVVDAAGRIEFVNRQAERLFGRPRDLLLGRPVEGLMQDPLRAGDGPAVAGAAAARPTGSSLELLGRRTDGSVFPIEIALSPIQDGERPLLAMAIRDVTERRHAELATMRLAAIVDSSEDAILSEALDGSITSWNRAAERIFGWTAAEALGRSIALLVPPDRADEQRDILERLSRGEPIRHFETVRLRKDGARLDVSVTVSPVRDRHGKLVGVSAIARDISAAKQAQAAAQLASDRLSEAIECIEEAFALFDRGDHLVMHNSAYRRLLAGVRGPLVGRTIADLLTEWTAAHGVPLADGKRWLVEHFAGADADHLVNEIESHGRAFREVLRRSRDGDTVLTISDRSEDRRREEALRRASAAKSEFLSSMSHELRTPLNAILGFAQLLQRDKRTPLTPRQLGMIDHVVKGGEHLLRLIDEILDLARIESGRVSISLETVEIGAVLEQVVTTLAPLAARAEVPLAVDPDAAAAPPVRADRTRFAQILMNLGSNAIKYSPPNTQARFAVSTPQPGRVRVSVIDQGIGIAPSEQDKIFQPFYRAGREASAIEGTGIGLTITKQLAELMGGCIGFHSAPGEGSTFWIDLPSAVEQAPAPGAPRAPGASPLAQAGEHFLIVYIEDHPANIAFMTELLADVARLELLTAPNAELGVELVRARRPHAVILDINLPGMSGIDALRLLRAWPETHDIPVIALSAAAMDHDVRRAQSEGFHRYLTKPVRVDELIAVLEELLIGPPAVTEA